MPGSLGLRPGGRAAGPPQRMGYAGLRVPGLPLVGQLAPGRQGRRPGLPVGCGPIPAVEAGTPATASGTRGCSPGAGCLLCHGAWWPPAPAGSRP